SPPLQCAARRGHETLAPHARREQMACRPVSSLVPTNRHAPLPLRRDASSSALRNTPCMPLPPRPIPPGLQTTSTPIPPRRWRVVPITPGLACASAKPGESASASRGRGLESLEGKTNTQGIRFVLQPPQEGNQGWLVWGEERESRAHRLAGSRSPVWAA